MGIGLVAYSIRVKQRRSEDTTFDNLDDIEGVDFFDFIKEFLEENSDDFYINEENKKAFKVESINTDNEKRIISGFTTYGDGGMPAHIRNIQNPNSIAYNKNENDAECIPLYYLFYLPTSDRGIILLEKFGQKSAKTIFKNLISKKFAEELQNKTLYIDLLPQRRLIELFMTQGIVKQLTLSSFKSPGSKIEDFYANNGQSIENVATYDFTIRANRNKNLSFLKEKISRIFNRTANISSINDLIGIRSYEPNQLKVTYSIRGTQKTIKLDGLDDINVIYDITDKFENPYIHPEYSKINPIAQEYLNDLLGWKYV